MKKLWTWIWHFMAVGLALASLAAAVGIWHGADVHLGDNMTAYKVGDEGPHVFLEGDRWVQKTLRGSRDEGFHVEEESHPRHGPFAIDVLFPLDNSRFTVHVEPPEPAAGFVSPPVRYQDGAPVLAVSDIEGNYKTFRDLLIAAQVIDANLDWKFGRGHLVLIGDFVDRGASTTQVLWLIYKLEQAAARHGGRVHYILGNHEIKNLQGNFQAAHKKYVNIAGMLGKQQHELFGEQSFIGQWLMSKNSVELINGVLFAHGGLHPILAELPYTLEDINAKVRQQYRQMFYPKKAASRGDVLSDTSKGVAWYRGYFEGDLRQDDVEKLLNKFQARAIAVGHTPVWNIKTLFDGKVYAVDVRHPLDYRWTLPARRSQALWLEADQAWRVHDDGERQPL